MTKDTIEPQHPLPLPSKTPQHSAFCAKLDALPMQDRVVAAMDAAAELLEYAAFELAQVEKPGRVTRLVLLTADMQRAADDLRAGVAWPAPVHAR